ncbi:hypothetical protein BS78_07G036200 [Paspalum vaginatum]|nr:hypothetical protein BS78_07G036200 [Paspalum vaginatum]
MEGHKVVLAFVLAVLMAGQLVAEAVVVREAHDGTPPIVDGARLPVPAARGPRKSPLLLPPEGSQRTAAGIKEDKAVDVARSYFIPPFLPPCRRKAC